MIRHDNKSLLLTVRVQVIRNGEFSTQCNYSTEICFVIVEKDYVLDPNLLNTKLYIEYPH